MTFIGITIRDAAGALQIHPIEDVFGPFSPAVKRICAMAEAQKAVRVVLVDPEGTMRRELEQMTEDGEE